MGPSIPYLLVARAAVVDRHFVGLAAMINYMYLIVLKRHSKSPKLFLVNFQNSAIPTTLRQIMNYSFNASIDHLWFAVALMKLYEL